MSRYIDADALDIVYEDGNDTLVRNLDDMPTIDAVEVVRCGECIHHEEPRDTFLKAFVWCNFYNTHKLKDGYCNCGERKEKGYADN